MELIYFDKNKNLIFSPLSIATLLNITEDATAGKTRDEIRKLTGSRVPDISSPNLTIANAVCVKKEYKNVIKRGYEEHLSKEFNGKLFTSEDYMGMTDNTGEGFRLIDNVVSWCRQAGLFLILDMHDCPGGQTGDNIDDSYGYPWLFRSERSQRLFCDIWQQIARRYQDEPVILGYELMNEPIAHYFKDSEEMKQFLQPLYKRAVAAIREVDTNHVIILGGAHWNSHFYMFDDWTFDDNIMYTCHRYGGPATADAIRDYIDFRDKTELPMFMGELGHNTIQWQEDFVRAMKENDIGYTFWPYKMVSTGSSMMGIIRPEQWDSIVVKFSEAPRGTYQEIRDARPDQELARQLLRQFLDNSRFVRCEPQEDYIRSMGLDSMPSEKALPMVLPSCM